MTGVQTCALPILDILELFPSHDRRDIDGSEVATVYYEHGDINRIAIYCQKDVVATIQVYLKLIGESIIQDKHIQLV